MMHLRSFAPVTALTLCLTGAVACQPASAGPAPAAATPPAAAAPTDDLAARARKLAHRFIITDGHVDVPYRLYATRDEHGAITEDLSRRTASGDFDIPRARAGGLDAPFMSIYVPARHQEDGTAGQVARELVAMVRDFERRWPDQVRVATSVADVRAAFAAGQIALPMGLENGAPVARVADVQAMYDLGIRYITLTHSKDNALSDSSFDDRHTHGGLSELGKAVVREMNRVGIMVDVSHLSDQAFWHVMDISQAPVIASHSSARHFTPGWARNMSDDMIRALAAKGGVIMVNFGSSFLDDAVRKAREKDWDAIERLLADKGLSFGAPTEVEIRMADRVCEIMPGMDMVRMVSSGPWPTTSTTSWAWSASITWALARTSTAWATRCPRACATCRPTPTCCACCSSAATARPTCRRSAARTCCACGPRSRPTRPGHGRTAEPERRAPTREWPAPTRARRRPDWPRPAGGA